MNSSPIGAMRECAMTGCTALTALSFRSPYSARANSETAGVASQDRAVAPLDAHIDGTRNLEFAYHTGANATALGRHVTNRTGAS